RTVAFERADAEVVIGDTDAAEIRIDVPDGIRKVVVNGTARPAHHGIATTTLPAPERTDVPDLAFRVAEEASEAQPDFDDSSWLRADSTQGSTPFQGPGRGGVVLDSNHYGFYQGSFYVRQAGLMAGSAELRIRANGGTGQPPHGQEPAVF